jgi:hypothetical protein
VRALQSSAIALAALACACGAPSAPRESNPNAPALSGTPARAGGSRAGDASRASDASSATGASSAKAPPARKSGLEIARVGGRSIDASELLGLWMHSESAALGEYVDRLVNTRIARDEARRLGVCVEPAAVDARFAVARAELDALVQKQRYAGGVDAYVKERLGLDAERYFARVREQCEDQLRAERAVRTWLHSSERAELHVIVVADAERAEEVRAALAGGLSFEDAAKRYSLDASREHGGRVPPVVRSERSPLAQLAFRTRPGDIAGPLEQEGKLLLAHVDGHLPASSGGWAELGPEVLRSLEEQPIEDAEFWQWRAAMERFYEVDLSPLLELAR